MANYKITSVEFDFESDGEYPDQEYQANVIRETMEKLWEADDADELVDQISDHTGWCILNVEFHLLISYTDIKESLIMAMHGANITRSQVREVLLTLEDAIDNNT